MRRAPYPPLAPGGEGLDAPPTAPLELRQRMAEVYGVQAACLLPVRGALHGIELAARCANASGHGIHTIKSPDGRTTLDVGAAHKLAKTASLVVIDESLIEFSETPTLAAFACASSNFIVLRDLSFAYGLAGAPCGAAIANPSIIARLEAMLEPCALATPTARLALAVLDASRLPLTHSRWRTVRAERARIATQLSASDGVRSASEGAGPYVFARFTEPAIARAAIAAFMLEADEQIDGAFRLDIGAPAYNERLLAAFGAGATKPSRRAEIVRDTKETRIVVAVDLDRAGEAQIATGIGFFDHMLGQVALHGGFSLSLTCVGDLHIDTHHTLEDCAIALGQALDKALGDRRGIGRFGFLLPMDETEAQVSLDLSGRPFAVFSGAFNAPLIGAYPTEMTAHIFRSLAENMRASIHISVSGENDHHKTEACFKALGRALRAAIRVQGDATPSTKGVL